MSSPLALAPVLTPDQAKLALEILHGTASAPVHLAPRVAQLIFSLNAIAGGEHIVSLRAPPQAAPAPPKRSRLPNAADRKRTGAR